MKITSLNLVFLAIACLLMAPSACAPPVKPAIGYATVNATHASLRSRNSATSRTLKVLEPGERVELLEQQDRWFRVRLGETEGWMEISTILTDDSKVKIEAAANEARGQTAQNSGVLTQDANLRLEPGRSTAVLRRLPRGTAVDVLERRTMPREDVAPERLVRDDAWLKVRTERGAGWLLSSFVEFDVPEEISRYTEDFIYSAVKTVFEVNDPALGPVRWYVVAERRPGTQPDLDFTGIRVFTWNSAKQRYETAYRVRNLRGIYPVEVGKDDSGRPTFSFRELSADGGAPVARDFVMNGVVVRESRKRPG